MPTAACGIQCEVCRLNRLGVCTSCGPGGSRSGLAKERAQVRLLGGPCPILACANLKGIAHCMRDCEQFPCENFASGPYPYARSYLDMQRRRIELAGTGKPAGAGQVVVPQEYWKELGAADPADVCRRTGARIHPGGGLVLACMGEDLLVDAAGRRVFGLNEDGAPELREYPLLELMVLVYLLSARDEPPLGEPATVRDLASRHFFTGPHAIDTTRLTKRFGKDPEAFARAARRMGGRRAEMGDAAWTIDAFPGVPVTVVLWLVDEEFDATASVLFDKGIERHLAPDAIWGVSVLVLGGLVRAAHEFSTE